MAFDSRDAIILVCDVQRGQHVQDDSKSDQELAAAIDSTLLAQVETSHIQ